MNYINDNFITEYNSLEKSFQQVYLQIIKAHDFYSKKDKKYRRIVRLVKIFVLFVGMANTIVLGINWSQNTDAQITVGLILSSMITFFTAISSYFNFEKYWMRNITKHIELNILRDQFQLDVVFKRIDNQIIIEYQDKLKKIQEDNIKYWNDVLDKV